ncbi:MAG: DUF4124 domain-containing protein [Hydrogenophaga sp.]|uniref:DUF4124 domain-containing protein n=1 Tax=Hydrogenophaga sp. TaxID=1904254 RepID=UPI00273371C0|nr:DUF4124 domain-containing protein [Hydrogenophaga sp.]MDP3626804.1 DUF4124 domain-containing protein [Hydrogenophaga sp.]
MPHQAHASVRPIARALALAWCSVGLAQAAIFTCVDAQGRRITSDRPIAACMDREQRELSPSGSVRRVIPPEPTAEERAALEAKRKADAERDARLNEEKRRERALLSRYPNEAAHQRERVKALESVDAVEAAIHKRIEELVKLRAGLDEEMAFYAKDPAKAPPLVQRKLKDNKSLLDAQQAALKQQTAERQRVSERFDAELVQLRTLWAQAATPSAR